MVKQTHTHKNSYTSLNHTHLISQLDPHLLRHSSSHTHGSYSAGLGATNLLVILRITLEQEYMPYSTIRQILDNLLILVKRVVATLLSDA